MNRESNRTDGRLNRIGFDIFTSRETGNAIEETEEKEEQGKRRPPYTSPYTLLLPYLPLPTLQEGFGLSVMLELGTENQTFL